MYYLISEYGIVGEFKTYERAKKAQTHFFSEYGKGMWIISDKEYERGIRYDTN